MTVCHRCSPVDVGAEVEQHLHGFSACFSHLRPASVRHRLQPTAAWCCCRSAAGISASPGASASAEYRSDRRQGETASPSVSLSTMLGASARLWAANDFRASLRVRARTAGSGARPAGGAGSLMSHCSASHPGNRVEERSCSPVRIGTCNEPSRGRSNVLHRDSNGLTPDYRLEAARWRALGLASHSSMPMRETRTTSRWPSARQERRRSGINRASCAASISARTTALPPRPPHQGCLVMPLACVYSGAAHERLQPRHSDHAATRGGFALLGVAGSA
jgi:hypothetical protein